MKHKILIVDDEPAVANTLCMIFEKCGYECRVSYTASEAVACCEEFCPELLLYDLSMPVAGSQDVVLHIAQKYPGCRVLVLTGHYTNVRLVREWVSTHPGPSRIMTKPVAPALLLQEAHALLHQSAS